MSESISSIREKLQAAGINELPAIFSQYEKDERAGVQKEIERARKRLEAYRKELERCENLKKYEREYETYAHICGIDEVGRGPLAGPVVAGAVILPIYCISMILRNCPKKREKSSMM